MIESKFILNILDLLLDGDAAGKSVRSQIDHLTDSAYDYTGVGLFVTFQSSDEISKHKYSEDRLILDGVTITSPELKNGALAILFLNGGIINSLEIWSCDGEYPRKELESYTLKQMGTYATGRRIDGMI